jgi:hypothetical protein
VDPAKVWKWRRCSDCKLLVTVKELYRKKGLIYCGACGGREIETIPLQECSSLGLEVSGRRVSDWEE